MTKNNGSSTPSTHRLAKSGQCMNAEDDPALLNDMEVCTPQAEFHPHPGPITSFLTSCQPMSDSMLKDMHLSLWAPLQADMLLCIHGFKEDLHKASERVGQIEDKMGEYASSFNSLVDAHNAHRYDLQWLKAKVADLGDRSHRNNIKIRGIPVSVQHAQLAQYVQDLFKCVAPSLTPEDLIIDRIHRFIKPAHLPQSVQWDRLLRINFFQAIEKVLSA